MPSLLRQLIWDSWLFDLSTTQSHASFNCKGSRLSKRKEYSKLDTQDTPFSLKKIVLPTIYCCPGRYAYTIQETCL